MMKMSLGDLVIERHGSIEILSTVDIDLTW